MTDTVEFKIALVKIGMSMNELAKKIGISRTSLSYKVNNKVEFTAKEICAIRNCLNLTEAEMNKIFFANDVD